MTELCCLCLQPLWEEMTCAKFLSLSQSMGSFWEFVVLVQKTNSLLKGNPSHKDPHVVHECIEGGMDQVLFKRCIKEKVDKIMHDDKLEELQLWMDKVKQIDNKNHEDAVQEFEAWSYAHRNLQRSKHGSDMIDLGARRCRSCMPWSNNVGHRNSKSYYIPSAASCCCLLTHFPFDGTVL